MFELGEHARFAQESRSRTGSESMSSPYGLESHLTLEGLIEADVDLAHAASVEKLLDADSADGLADE
jgi:hypothetical protein